MTRKYTTDIERLIFDLLLQKDKPVLYTQLYNSVKGARKKLSYETYDIHLSHLKENGLVEKTTKGYSCSDRAYFLYGLKILDFNRPNKTFLDPMESEDMEHRLKMLFIVSYYGNWKGFYRLQSREQFDDFLYRHKISENDLRVDREYDSGNKVPPKHIKEFMPDPVYHIEIRIVEEKLNENIGKIYYDYFLPGFSIVEVLKAWERRHLEFYDLDFTRSDLQEEIDILLSHGLLDQIGELDNEIRYRFPRRLQLVLGQCSELNDDLFSVMIKIFVNHRSPTIAEKRWLDFFYGRQTNGPVEQWLRDLRHNRRFIKGKNKNIVVEIGKCMVKIHKNFVNIMDSLSNEKYRYFIEKILEYIYPPFMRKSCSSSNGIEEYLRTQA